MLPIWGKLFFWVNKAASATKSLAKSESFRYGVSEDFFYSKGLKTVEGGWTLVLIGLRVAFLISRCCQDYFFNIANTSTTETSYLIIGLSLAENHLQYRLSFLNDYN